MLGYCMIGIEGYFFFFSFLATSNALSILTLSIQGWPNLCNLCYIPSSPSVCAYYSKEPFLCVCVCVFFLLVVYNLKEVCE